MPAGFKPVFAVFQDGFTEPSYRSFTRLMSAVFYDHSRGRYIDGNNFMTSCLQIGGCLHPY